MYSLPGNGEAIDLEAEKDLEGEQDNHNRTNNFDTSPKEVPTGASDIDTEKREDERYDTNGEHRRWYMDRNEAERNTNDERINARGDRENKKGREVRYIPLALRILRVEGLVEHLPGNKEQEREPDDMPVREEVGTKHRTEEEPKER